MPIHLFIPHRFQQVAYSPRTMHCVISLSSSLSVMVTSFETRQVYRLYL